MLHLLELKQQLNILNDILDKNFHSEFGNENDRDSAYFEIDSFSLQPDFSDDQTFGASISIKVRCGTKYIDENNDEQYNARVIDFNVDLESFNKISSLNMLATLMFNFIWEDMENNDNEEESSHCLLV